MDQPQIKVPSDLQKVEKWFWEDIHPYCKECFNSCKQSSKIIEMVCPNKNKIGWCRI